MGLPPEVRARFEREFERAYTCGLAYALKRARVLPWVSSQAQVVSAARELLSTALTETLAYEARRWDPKRVDLSAFLCGVIKSVASNAVARSRAEALERSGLDDVEGRADVSVGRPHEPEEFYLSHEACAQIEAEAHALAGEDPLIARFLSAVHAGLHEVDEICRATGLTAKEVYAARGKLSKRRARRAM